MRNFSIVALSLFVSLGALAEPRRPNSFIVFISNPEYEWTNNGSHANAGFGLGLQHAFTPQWSLELSATHQRDRSRYTISDSNGNIIASGTITSNTNPIDLIGRYHFAGAGSWKPYMGLGVSHTNSHDARTFGVLNGGVLWQLRQALGIRFDGKLLAGGKPGYINRFNASAGLAWRW